LIENQIISLGGFSPSGPPPVNGDGLLASSKD
jgi:hypothetical protein